MSYILDALNRADAERERGSVPGLHARQTYVKTSKVSNEHSRLWMALVVTLTIAGISAGVWFWRAPADTAPPAIAELAIVAAPAEPPTPPAPVPTATVAAPTTAPKAAPKPTPNGPVGIPLLSELASDVRSQVPPLTITGAVYSKTPGQRLLLVNNQVLNQGNLAAPQVTLEEIRVNSSVFSFRGTRFRLAH